MVKLKAMYCKTREPVLKFSREKHRTGLPSSKRTHVATYLILAFLIAPILSKADVANTFSAFAKLQGSADGFDTNSVFANSGDSPQDRYNIDSRLMYQGQQDQWTWQVHYQLAIQKNPANDIAFGAPSSADRFDQYRLWNFSRKLSDSDDLIGLQRLDRFFIRYSAEQWVIKLGRQAISWGHGQFFNPLDIANPFDPALIDKEYKVGDDMVYGQYLQSNGNDIQGVIIPRRDDVGHIQSSQSTYAVKYRGFRNNIDFDLLLARHYADNAIGFGANIPWRESNINSDWLLTQLRTTSSNDWVVSGNIGISYSWVAWNKNVLGRAEYFHNGFGLAGSSISLSELINKPALSERLQRGELYTMAMNYLAAGVNIELHPLFTTDVNIFTNLQDPSALLQVIGLYNQSDDSNISLGLIMPLGPDGSEYGGLQTTNGYLSKQYTVFAKYAHYW